MFNIERFTHSPFNPWNYEATKGRKIAAATLIAFTALTALAGTLAIITACGVNLHALNALSVLHSGGGSFLTAFSITAGGIGFMWLITKSKSKIQDIDSDDNDTFQLLEDLQKEREERKIPELPAPVSFSYPLLDDLKNKLAEPTLNFKFELSPKRLQVHVQREKDRFVEGMKRHIQMLVKGDVKILPTLQQNEVILEGELTHPSQVLMILEFASQKLHIFNKLLSEKDVPIIDIPAFIKEFDALLDEACIWNQLLQIEQLPDIDDQKFEILENISPPHYLKPQIEALIRRISMKQVSNLQKADKIFQELAKKLELENLATPISIYINQFNEDVRKLAQSLVQEIINDNSSFSFNHLNKLHEFIQKEELKLKSDGIEIQLFSEFNAILMLLEAKLLMNMLAQPEETIDNKVELLTEIAQKLPDADCPIWPHFSAMREQMRHDLIEFCDSANFSDFKFQPTLNEEDGIRASRIDSTLKTMAKKLGHPDLISTEIEMDTTFDDDIASVRDAYDQFGVEAAAQMIRQLAQRTNQILSGPDYVNELLAAQALNDISAQLRQFLLDFFN
jgi:hypothetical protein